MRSVSRSSSSFSPGSRVRLFTDVAIINTITPWCFRIVMINSCWNGQIVNWTIKNENWI